MEIAVTRRRMGRGRLLVTSALCIALLYVAVAFVSFARDIADIHVPTDPKADAIVVLTGGKERIEQAMRLLEEGRAERLLISGVHPGSSARQIARATSTDLPLFACCVDLDRAALNTFGNAAETAAWVARHDFKTLMVVTSAYHVPRAELELADTLPNVNLVLYPVFSSERDLSEWYANFDTMKLLMREYVKYTLARLRIAVDRWSI
ncbi:YdcF family protein [Roseibium sediminis]|uniref:YdcF family protein n=1 Tax=Roseibium sediminis TaxID=1775174 RepID=UPI001AD8D947|nr:YdcF family protein [Roseibium sediminis]